MFKKRIICSFSLLLTTCFLAVSCGSKEDVEPISESEPPIEAEVEEVSEETGPRSLLTNEITEADLSNKRPLAVMIENTQKCLPHYGLSDAGIIYEAPAEGGITRYMALYDDYENYDRLGNVRSARPYYIYFAAEYDAIYAHIGQSKDGERVLSTGIVDELNGLYGGNAFYRTSDRKAPHNAYIKSSGMLEDFKAKNISNIYGNGYGGHFNFATEENLLDEGEDVSTIRLYYTNNKPYFTYDPETKLYTRYAFGSLEPDAYSDSGIQVTNIIFEDADSKVVGGEGQLEIGVIGHGTGKFFTRGKMVDISWQKDSQSERTRYFMPNGEEIKLNTGKTFICVIENKSKSENSFE